MAICDIIVGMAGNAQLSVESHDDFFDNVFQVAPSSHQATQLKSAIDDAIVKEGLIGVGVGTGLVTVAAIAIGLLMSGRNR